MDLAAQRTQPDEVLLGLFRSGDIQAFELLLARHRDPLFRFILRYENRPERAEDLLQDVFMRLVQHKSDFSGKSSLKTWLYSIARNRCIDMRRRQKHRQHAPFEEAAKAAPLQASDRLVDTTRLRGHIQEAVAALPELQREVFLLRQVSGLPFADIAQIVECSENTVKSRMRYALTRLQETLAPFEELLRPEGGGHD